MDGAARGATGALKRYQDKRKHGVSERREQLVDELAVRLEVGLPPNVSSLKCACRSSCG
jgi:hypothetical protein